MEITEKHISKTCLERVEDVPKTVCTQFGRLVECPDGKKRYEWTKPIYHSGGILATPEGYPFHWSRVLSEIHEVDLEQMDAKQESQVRGKRKIAPEPIAPEYPIIE